MNCLKCGAVSGDAWIQCEGVCPISCSPHYAPKEIEKMLVEEVRGSLARLYRFLDGIVDEKCNYLATEGSVCNKCGQIHKGAE